jgi:nitroreductase
MEPPIGQSTAGGVSVEQEEWVRVVAAATRAPSIHNTQPWRFVASRDQLQVFFDPERALPVLDPTNRQQVISCGIVVEFAVIALAADGWNVDVELQPDASDADRLATLHVTGRREITDRDRTLAAAISRRHTVRAPFESRAVPAELVDALQAGAGAYQTWVKPITESEEEVATVFLISAAEESEQSNPAYMAELESWLRTDPGAVDGVPVEAVPSEDPQARPSDWMIRDFLVGSRERPRFLPAGDPDAPPPPVERPAVLLMGTMGDDRNAWLLSGRALGRLLLEATVEGLAASPLTQALDWAATRQRLRERLSLVGHPQMLLRMGYPTTSEGGTPSGRRPIDDVLRFQPVG